MSLLCSFNQSLLLSLPSTCSLICVFFYLAFYFTSLCSQDAPYDYCLFVKYKGSAAWFTTATLDFMLMCRGTSVCLPVSVFPSVRPFVCLSVLNVLNTWKIYRKQRVCNDNTDKQQQRQHPAILVLSEAAEVPTSTSSTAFETTPMSNTSDSFKHLFLSCLFTV